MFARVKYAEARVGIRGAWKTHGEKVVDELRSTHESIAVDEA
jgi:hypothetical protein